MTHRMPSGRFLGAKKDLHHAGDLAYAYRPGTRIMGPAPTRMDNVASTAGMIGVYDQQNEGSCSMNAGLRFLPWLMLHFPDLFGPLVPLSRQAGYWWERNLPWNGDTWEDAGASIRDIFVVLQKIGACPEEDDPYQYSTLTVDPGEKAVQDAACRRIGSYHRVYSVDDLKSLLAAGWCACLGFTVYPSLDEVGSDGIWSPDPSREREIGGHAVFVRGYDDGVNGGSFLIDNSWGTGWGREGSFWMPYSFLEDNSASQWSCFTGAPIYQPSAPVSA